MSIDDIQKDVISQTSLLNDTSIDRFLSVIDETTQFDTTSALWLVYNNFIVPSKMSQDISIIGGNTYRHWRCLSFDGTKLSVYDSMGCNGYHSLKTEEQRFISFRYPSLRTEDVVFPVVQKQPDSFSCGVYAAAFATTLALGGNPSDEIYSMDVLRMRNHLFRIIQSKELSAFPSV